MRKTPEHEAEFDPSTKRASAKVALVKAGMELFSQKPFAEVKLKDILTKANQKNRNALQYHFGSKKDLFDTILFSHVSEIEKIRQQLITSLDPGDPPELEIAIDIYVQPFIQYVRFNSQGGTCAKLMAHFLQMPERIEKALNKDSIFECQSDQLNQLLVSITPHLSRLERHQLMYLSTSIMVNTMAELVRAQEAGILVSTDRLYNHAVAKLVESLYNLWRF